MIEYFYKTECEIASDYGNVNLGINDVRYSLVKKDNVFNFVGFIFENNTLLSVFPKHFWDNGDEKSTENITLLFNTICKYINDEKNNPNANKFIGDKHFFESDYPFEQFFEIYNYYNRYGIFKEEEYQYKNNSNGKISWKKTIQKSNVIISDDNLIFTPLFSKHKNYKNDFISECMTYIINHTINTFPFFLKLSPINEKCSKMDFIANRKYVLRQLYRYKNYIFKDNNKRLLTNLIDFFEQIDKKPKGGSYHFKIRYFDKIWETIVGEYLNNYFVDVRKNDEGIQELIFNTEYKNAKPRFVIEERDRTFEIENKKDSKRIIPDHYYENEKNIYVFDSKYYQHISELNYKQLAYTFLIGNNKEKCKKKIYSALILPGNYKARYNLNIEGTLFAQDNDGCNHILECYLSVKTLMKNYLNMDISEEKSCEKVNLLDSDIEKDEDDEDRFIN